MQWSDKPRAEEFTMPDDIMDIQFKLDNKSIFVDHAYLLSQQILNHLPWLEQTADAALHLIHGAESGNGWLRENTTGTGTQATMYLSRRTKLTLRIPKERIDDAKTLTGKTLKLGGDEITIGSSAVKPLTVFPNLFSRYIISDQSISENDFLERVHIDLKHIGVNCSKMLCGRTHTIQFPDRTLFTRSLMIADLTPEESAILQQQGYGEGMKFGCGIFVPHKDIVPVADAK
ncbi:MAG: type I-MYXAN CRISPR-associated protein Cas6/Cmx6 [Methylococcales bacterium]|nr:type I-MYXAN CRISPR-associated protein Cas6/Cmx6 [Methylococcales bacterium]